MIKLTGPYFVFTALLTTLIGFMRHFARTFPGSSLFARWLVVACAFPCVVSVSQAGELVDAIKRTQNSRGLCIAPAFDLRSSTTCVTDVAAAGFIVHVLAADDAAADKMRRAAAAQGFAGQIIVEAVPFEPGLYPDNFANVVLVENDAKRRGRNDWLRIAAPGGLVCIKHDGKWETTVKPPVDGLDDWTHPAHGADGNRVSNDRTIRFPVMLRWQDGIPMNFNNWAAVRATVVAAGRCFSISTTEIENIDAAAILRSKEDEYLVARDAFNGLTLWKLACGTENSGKELDSRNAAPLATDGKHVYAVVAKQLSAVDARTGKIDTVFATRFPVSRLAVASGVVVTIGWKETTVCKDYASAPNSPLWAPWVAASESVILEAFDAEKGALLWSQSVPAYSMMINGETVFVMTRVGEPTKTQTVHAFDLKSGNERWKTDVSSFAPGMNAFLKLAAGGVLVIDSLTAKKTTVLDASTGAVLWAVDLSEKIGIRNAALLTPEGLWLGSQLHDPKTGTINRKVRGGTGDSMCTPVTVAGDYAVYGRGNSYMPLFGEFANTGKVATYGGNRGPCIQGVTPALGMLLSAQNNCRCSPGQIPGFIAFSTVDAVPASDAFTKSVPPISAATAKKKYDVAAPGDWPMFLGNAERGAHAVCDVPEKPGVLWTAPVWNGAKNPYWQIWRSRLNSGITAPVVAAGHVYAAAVDTGEIVALDAKDGKPAWRKTLGGRVDSPPTIAGKLCFAGAHDGYVYALDAADGSVAWRARLAPAERRMMAFGSIESVWPVLSSVLFHDGRIYASAGRSTEADGGVAIAAFDPVVGERVWSAHLQPSSPHRTNPDRIIRPADILAVRAGKVAMQHALFSPANGDMELSPAFLKNPAGKRITTGLEGFVDGSWTKISSRRAGGLLYRSICGDLLALSGDTVYAFNVNPANRTVCAAARSKVESSPDQLPEADLKWTIAVRPSEIFEAMAVCNNALVAAGHAAGSASGFVRLYSITDGKLISETPLPGLPVYAGLAIAGGRIYVAQEDGAISCIGR